MFHIEIAGHCLTIDNTYSYVEELCRDYITEEKKEIVIAVSQKEIQRENDDGKLWSTGYLESLAIYRKICELLLEKDIVLFHCSAIEIDGKAYLFTAPSGTGKSTHTRLWREFFGDKVIMINDDKPLLKISDEEIRVYGTPYGGKDGLQTNTSAPVAGIIILHQADKNVIQRVSASESYPMLLNQTYRRTDAKGLIKTMDLVQKLAQLPVYSLGCTISEEAVLLAYDAIIEKKEGK